MNREKPDKAEMARVTEDAEAGMHGRLDDPEAPPETGPIERGRVDAGPTGNREGGYRQAESGRRILIIAGVAILIILVVLAVAYFR
ncbi:MAG: hypothetical protein F9K43_04255 [Bauldia sp.]|nr:MAG: hypothetical protein F9K43_04255 [Bauldia sp.]MBZ0228921.1 hypothetical protein [Bauldia sp.]